MGTVTSIADRKPKLSVVGGPSDGSEINRYLIPLETAEQIAWGGVSISVLPQAAIEGIVRDWIEIAERSS